MILIALRRPGRANPTAGGGGVAFGVKAFIGSPAIIAQTAGAVYPELLEPATFRFDNSGRTAHSVNFTNATASERKLPWAPA
jgi:hypothetical protein